MEFTNLKTLSISLDENIRCLENSLSNSVSSMTLLFSEDKSEGIQTLQELCEQWIQVCEELDEANKKDDIEMQNMCQEFESNQTYFDALEEKRREYENVLLQKNFLVCEPEEPQNDDLSHVMSSLEISENSGTPVSQKFSTSHLLRITDHSTPEINFENTGSFEDTMADFNAEKIQGKLNGF